jgi:hypothetical protein
MARASLGMNQEYSNTEIRDLIQAQGMCASFKFSILFFFESSGFGTLKCSKRAKFVIEEYNTKNTNTISSQRASVASCSLCCS